MGFFRNLGFKMRSGIQRFMAGRYGSDKLNMTLLVIALVACLVAAFIPDLTVKLVLMILYYVLMVVAVFRMMSRKTYKRYQENRRFLLFFQKLKDRDHRYYDCPRCRQQIRVPKGKGKIAISCPKCKEKFIKKT